MRRSKTRALRFVASACIPTGKSSGSASTFQRGSCNYILTGWRLHAAQPTLQAGLELLAEPIQYNNRVVSRQPLKRNWHHPNPKMAHRRYHDQPLWQDPRPIRPVFISYSRRDYYFAESLALHLLKDGIPAWLDVKDLNPGVFWERDLFAALEGLLRRDHRIGRQHEESKLSARRWDRAISQKSASLSPASAAPNWPTNSANARSSISAEPSTRACANCIARLKMEPPGTQACSELPIRSASGLFSLLGCSHSSFAVPLFVDLLLADWSGDRSSPGSFLLVAAVGARRVWLDELSRSCREKWA